MRPLLIIGGATGSGKSDIAVACAKKLDGEIVSCDSMQIYRGLDIGTAKITSDEMQGIPHHMIDIVDPSDGFTAAEYKGKANAVIAEILSRGKVPILCGGTGLYINAVLYDLSFTGEYDQELRDRLMHERAVFGKEYMHEKLSLLDPDAAARLHVNDEKRVIRAIEKAITGGRSENDLSHAKYPHLLYITSLSRDLLYARIEKRVDRMIASGLKDEVFHLLSEGIGFDKQCMQAIAYKEWAYEINGEMTEEEVVSLIKKNTRNYAKRQITWFKQYQEARLIDVTSGSIDAISDKICKEYEEI